MNNINMDELIADREVGSSAWEASVNARRIGRINELEAAYIEAVELIREVREHLADGNIGKAIVRIDRGPLEGAV